MPTILITGANRGLGLEMARQYMADGWSVYGAVREPAKAAALVQLGEDLPGEFHALIMDVTKPQEVDEAAQSIAGVAIDLLVNNAANADGYGTGAYENVDDPDPRNYDYGLWEEILQVNLLAPTRVTGAFSDNLALGSEPVVVMMGSGLSSISNTWQAGRYAYRTSKAALNMMVRSMGEWLEGRGIAIFTLSPGWTRTDMGGPNAVNSVEESVTGMRVVIAQMKLENTGSYLNFDGEDIPW